MVVWRMGEEESVWVGSKCGNVWSSPLDGCGGKNSSPGSQDDSASAPVLKVPSLPLEKSEARGFCSRASCRMEVSSPVEVPAYSSMDVPGPPPVKEPPMASLEVSTPSVLLLSWRIRRTG